MTFEPNENVLQIAEAAAAAWHDFIKNLFGCKLLLKSVVKKLNENSQKEPTFEPSKCPNREINFLAFSFKVLKSQSRNRAHDRKEQKS